MKNAYVLEHHFGDDGNVAEGVILTDVSEKRFHALEKLGIVREATADEIKAGTVIAFVTEEEQRDSDVALPDFLAVQTLRDALTERCSEIDGLRLEIGELQKQSEESLGDLGKLLEASQDELRLANERQVELEEALADAISRAEAGEKRAAEMEQKASDAAANKKAADPENKLAPEVENKSAKPAAKAEAK